MTDSSEANKERNRQIARNEEAKQIAGGVRISSWAITIAVIIGAVVAALIWIAAR
jgi:uncharacterized protein HemX